MTLELDLHMRDIREYDALEQLALAKLSDMVHGMELWNCRSSSFSTEGAIYIPRAAITLAHILHCVHEKRPPKHA